MNESTCSVESCNKPAAARGWCRPHWNRWHRTGDVQADKPLRKSPETAVQGCVMEGCPGVHYAKRYCHRHYKPWSVSGDPLGRKPDGPRGLLRNRLDSLAGQVQHRDRSECWTDGGFNTNDSGYPMVGRKFIGHLAMEADGRPRPDGASQLHSCDNPSCWNPGHLRWGTHAENMADMVARGRSNPVRGADHRSAKLSEEDVRSIRRRVANGEGQRALGREFRVNASTVNRIVKSTYWTHL